MPLEFIKDDTVNNSNLLAMKIAVQRRNTSLAQKLANAFLSQKQPTSCHTLTPREIREGVERFIWICRFQQIVQGDHRWFLDGAHNETSVPYTTQWFADVTKDLRYGKRSYPETAHTDVNMKLPGLIPRVLIFSHISERDGAAILRAIAKILREHEVSIHHLMISTYEERLDGTREIGKLSILLCVHEGLY